MAFENRGKGKKKLLTSQLVFPPFPQNISLLLTLSQMTNFRLFQTERVCRRQFQI